MTEFFTTVPTGYRLGRAVMEPVRGRKHYCSWSQKLYLLEPPEPDVWSLGIPAHQHLTAAAVDPELVLR